MPTLTSEVLRSFAKSGPAYDGNMRLAVCLGLILAHWYARIHRAKMMDPRRPIARRDNYPGWLRVATAYQLAFLDESKDDVILKGQPWNNPFWPHKRGGQFGREDYPPRGLPPKDLG